MLDITSEHCGWFVNSAWIPEHSRQNCELNQKGSTDLHLLLKGLFSPRVMQLYLQWWPLAPGLYLSLIPTYVLLSKRLLHCQAPPAPNQPNEKHRRMR